MLSAIVGEPVLSEIRANQITRVTADDLIYEELPFLLRVPGDPDDFDATLWSAEMIEEHTALDDLDRNMFRVAYVNGLRWFAYPTIDGGSRMLLESEFPPGLPDVRDWATLTIAEDALDQEDSFQIGLATELAVVATHTRTESWIAVPKPVVLCRRAADPAGQAAMTVEWLLDWLPEQLGLESEAHRQMLVQLLVEVAVRRNIKEEVPASYLAAGHRDQPDEAGNAIWSLYLHLPAEALAHVADIVAQRGPVMAKIVTAATNPESPEGRSRRSAVEALGEWALEIDKPEPVSIADVEDDQRDEGDPEDDPNAPWNRDPIEGMPAVIEPGQIRMVFWNSFFDGDPVAYDFIFTWDGGRKADWYYDISMQNDGLSVMSSAPIGGTASWEDGVDVHVTVQSSDFDLDEEVVFKGMAPKEDATREPRTWVDLGYAIAGEADGFIV
ncbi:MAG: hypothetical protein ACKOI2_04805 [Actinomycetota bacterium]